MTKESAVYWLAGTDKEEAGKSWKRLVQSGIQEMKTKIISSNDDI